MTAETTVRRKTSVDVRVPLGAAPGPVAVVDSNGARLGALGRARWRSIRSRPPTRRRSSSACARRALLRRRDARGRHLRRARRRAGDRSASTSCAALDGVVVAHWDVPARGARGARSSSRGTALCARHGPGRRQVRVPGHGRRPGAGERAVRVLQRPLPDPRPVAVRHRRRRRSAAGAATRARTRSPPAGRRWWPRTAARSSTRATTGGRQLPGDRQPGRRHRLRRTCTCATSRWSRPATACDGPADRLRRRDRPRERLPPALRDLDRAGLVLGRRADRPAADAALLAHAAAEPLALFAVRVLTVVGNRPQFVKAAAVSHRGCARSATRCSSTRASTTTTRSRACSSTSSSCRGPSTGSTSAAGPTPSRPRGCCPSWRRCWRPRRRTSCSSTATRTRRWRARWRPRRPGVPVAHVEAGMRSYDRAMPEELNRVLTDHASSLLLCSSPAAAETLRAEQVVGEVVLVGDVMVDVFELLAPRADAAMLCAAGRRRGRVPARHRAPGGQRRRSRAAAGARRRADRDAAAGRAAAASAHARAAGRGRAAGRAGRRDRRAAARLPGVHGAAARRARRADGLRRRAEGGLPGRQAVHHAARHDRVARDVDAGWNVLVDLDAPPRSTRWSAPVPAARPPLYGDGRAGERVVEALVRMAG